MHRKPLTYYPPKGSRIEWQPPHLICRGHTSGHSKDQLLRDWLISGSITVSFCPILCTNQHVLALLNRIATRLGVKGSQVQILSARPLSSMSKPVSWRSGNRLLIVFCSFVAGTERHSPTRDSAGRHARCPMRRTPAIEAFIPPPCARCSTYRGRCDGRGSCSQPCG